MKPDLKLKNIGGIYQLRNTVNGKCYVGRTKCFYKRCHQYIYDFRKRSIGHLNDYLYRAMRKHGFENFEMEVLEVCEADVICERELHWIDLKGDYNLRRDVGGVCITHDMTKEKISKRLKSEWANGSRSGHSDKVKASWSNRDREAQSKQLSLCLTKYTYVVDGVPMNYAELKKAKLHSSLSSFSRRKLNSIICKGHVIERVLVHG